eukprot:CAMPEP_0167762104 /NCGR_PEP_ID=MMETSP0110_2-20121227/12558_1 /TAXON_ID=629695 /ORGANISM="Gymnochlora sp., Strain CCMP2014" /LENGTH=333 /DNA_ID=CAMNT_0007648893 /DNA_START=90 /DNA_END=1091 /DNA_ORIENTATION=-
MGTTTPFGSGAPTRRRRYFQRSSPSPMAEAKNAKNPQPTQPISTPKSEFGLISARSGGRVGGSVRSGGGGMRSAPMRRGYGSPSISGGPNVYINPYPSPFFSPFFNPFFGGFGGIGFVTPLPLSVLVLGAFGLVAWRAMRSQAAFLEAATGTVMLLQIAVYCGDRGRNSLYGRLNSLAQEADTYSEEGLRTLVQEATIALLRSEEDWVAGRSETFQKGMFGNSNDVESAFNQNLLKERAKFEDERSGGRTSGGAPGEKPSHMVVTILVALRDAPTLPLVKGFEDMRAALAMTSARASIEDNLLAAEVLWTPEDPGDTMSREELFLKFPELIDL